MEEINEINAAEEAELEAAAERQSNSREQAKSAPIENRPWLVRKWLALGTDEGCGIMALSFMGAVAIISHYPDAVDTFGAGLLIGWVGVILGTRISWIYDTYPDPFGRCMCPHGKWCRLSIYNPITKADVEGDAAPNSWPSIRTVGGHRDAVLACRGRCKHHRECWIMRKMTSEIEEPERIRGRGYIRSGDVWISPDHTEIVQGGRVQRGNFEIGSDGRIYQQPTKRRKRAA